MIGSTDADRSFALHCSSSGGRSSTEWECFTISYQLLRKYSRFSRGSLCRMEMGRISMLELGVDFGS